MRCNRCPALETEGFEYPLDYCSIGVDEEYRNENAKGEHGCTLHYKTIAKYGVAMEALKNQIPLKPVDVEDKMWCCPSCYNNLLTKWVKYPEKLMPKSSGLPYCMSCGQAIDWSEV